MANRQSRGSENGQEGTRGQRGSAREREREEGGRIDDEMDDDPGKAGGAWERRWTWGVSEDAKGTIDSGPVL